MEAANGIAMMFSVHGAEEIGGCFVARFLLTAAPFDKQAVAESPKQAHQPHCLGQAHSAQVISVGDIQALVQAAFNAPGRPMVCQPLGGVELRGRQARHQGHDFG